MSVVVNKNLGSMELRKFGLVLGALLLIFFYAIRPLLFDTPPIHLWGFLAILIVALALGQPMALKPLHKFWMILGNVLGAINIRILLGVMFFLVITPVGILLRVFGKDLLNLKLDPKLTSYRLHHSSTEVSQQPF